MRVVASFDPSVTSTIPSGPKAGVIGGTFDLKQTGGLKFKVKNDSNISIHLFFPNGTDSVVVAGEEMLFCTSLPTSIVTWTQDVALNVNGAPLVSRVYVTLYDQTDREQGTYPFHITRLTNLGSTVPIATSANVSTLSFEGNASQALVIDIGQTGHTLLVTINSDGSFTWSVLQSGTAHQVLKAQTSGNPLLIGQTNDTSEVLGNFLVDGTTQLDAGRITTDGFGHIDLNNDTSYGARDSGGTARSIMRIDTLDQVQLGGNSGPGGGHGAVVINSDTVAVWKILSGSSGVQLLNGTINLLAGSISRMDGGNVNCGSGTTISHGCGQTPTVIATPHGTQPGSATVGVGNENSSTFQATIGALSQIAFWAFVR